MKDVMMLLGFSFGLVTGALMYKYSQNTKNLIDEGEKKVMKEAKKMGEKAEEGMQKVEEGMQKVEKNIKKKAKAIQKKLSQN